MTALAGPITLDLSASCGAEGDMAFIRNALDALGTDGRGVLRIYRPGPTAAFSRLDSLLPGYDSARQIVTNHGFQPVLRPAGGHLAVYDETSVVVDLVAPFGPDRDPMQRFAFFAKTLLRAFNRLDVSGRIASLPNEYCPGTFSIAAGSRKVAGLAQRQSKHGFHLGAVLMVGSADRPRAAMAAAYPALNLPLDPKTAGSLSDVTPGITCTCVTQALLDEFQTLSELHLTHPEPNCEGVLP